MSPFVHPDSTYFDEDGVLRYNKNVRRERDSELRQITEADAQTEISAWYIVSASWMEAWLAFANGFLYKDKSSPSPGPIWNEELLIQGEDVWLAKPGLIPQTSDRKSGPNSGHYRRVNNHVWQVFTELYPGSGPTILCDYEKPDDVTLWRVIPSDPNPNPNPSDLSKSIKKDDYPNGDLSRVHEDSADPSLGNIELMQGEVHNPIYSQSTAEGPSQGAGIKKHDASSSITSSAATTTVLSSGHL